MKVAGRSDFLPDIRRFLELQDDLKHFIGPIATYPVVVDANVLIAELMWMSKQAADASEPPHLLECIVAGTVVAYVTSDIVAEVERNMPKIAAKRRIPAATWMAHWAVYKPRLRVENPDPAIVANYVHARDPTDAPTLALAKVVEVCGILSKDPDIPAMGGKVVPIRFKIEVRDYSRQAATFVSLQIGGVYVAVGAVDAVVAAAKALRRALEGFRSLPDWLKLLALAAVAAAILYPKSRAAIVDMLKATGATVVDAFPTMLALMLEAAKVIEENRAIPPVVSHL